MSMKRRMICLSMAGLLALSGPAPLFGQSTSEEMFNDLLSRYSDMLLDDNKEDNLIAFYEVYAALTEMDFKQILEDEVTGLSDEEKDRLEKFGFGSTPDEVAASIYEVYQAMLEQMPKTSTDFTESSDNIFSKIYFEGDDLNGDDYSKFFPELEGMGHEVYDHFPQEFRDEIWSWVKDTDNDQLDVFNALYSAMIDEKIGTEKSYQYRASANDYTAVNLGIKSSTKTVMLTALDGVTNDKVTDESQEEIVNTYYSIMNAILDAMESKLELTKVMANASEHDTNVKALSLLRSMDILKKESDYVQPPKKDDDDDDRPSGGGNSGGGNNSGGGSSSPTTDPDSEEGRTVEVDDEETPQGPVDVTKKYESEKLDAANDLKSGLADQTAEEAAKSIETLTKDIASEMDVNNVNSYEAVQIAETVTELVEELLEKPDLTAEEAQTVVKAALETTLKNAVARDIEGANTAEMNKKAVELVDEVVKKAGQVKAETNDVVLSSDAIQSALDNANKVVAEMKATLVESGFAKAAAEVKPVISIELTESTDLQEVEITPETVEALKSVSAEVEINLGSMKFRVPSELLAEYAESGIAVESDILAAEETTEVKAAEAADGTDVDVVSDVYEIEFKAGGADAEIGAVKPRLSIDVSKLIETLTADAHKLSVFVFNEESKAWDHIPTKIVDGMAEFEAPHFSKYAVLKANVEFDDIKGHWAQETIEMMTANKITSGRSEKSFEPDAAITRAEFAAYLVNMIGLEGEVHGNFRDVPVDAWYYDHVALAGINGLVSGVGEGNFAPDATITRQDMAVMISKAYKLMNGTEMKGNASAFGDSILIADYAYDAVSASRYHSIIGGFADGSFRPSKTATRAEAAQMLRSLFEE